MAKDNNASTADRSKLTRKVQSKTDEEKRAALKEKIAQAEERQAQRSLSDQAKGAADSTLEFVRANPLKTVAAVAIGALVIGALTRPGRRAGARAGRKAGALASVATDAAVAYGLSLLDGVSNAASKGQDKLAHAGNAVSDRASAWKSSATHQGGDLSDYLVRAAKRGGKNAGKSLKDLRNRLSH